VSACLSPADLARLARGESMLDEAMETHASECAVCSQRIGFLRGCMTAGANEIAEEALEIAALLRELEETPGTPLRWWRFVQQPRFHRPSLVRRLVALAIDARRKNTKIAIGYSATATQIVELLAANQEQIADLRFQAWRHHAFLLCEASKYDECRAALVTAEEAAAQTADPELSRGLVLLSRAILNIEPDVWVPDECCALIEQAERIFSRRDPDRHLRAKTVRGILLGRCGDYGNAAAILAEVLAFTPPADESAYAEALHNYLWAVVQAGRVDDELTEQLSTLEFMDEHHGATLSVLRDHWMRALLVLGKGRAEEAAALLRDTMRGFETHGDIDTALRVGLDAVRAFLQGERYPEAVELARDLVSRSFGLDTREPTRRRTLTAEAIAYLRDAAQLGALTADLVSTVARYVDTIRAQRPIDFVPPMPLSQM
jgi:hypothetical protein